MRPTTLRTVSAITSLCLAAMFAAAAAAGPSIAAPAAARPGSVLPPGFRAQSMSWISPQQGWILGVQMCGTDSCTTVLGTADGGATWNPVGTIAAALTPEVADGVTEIRFADARHGWAFGPGLWTTSDGGATWRKQRASKVGGLVWALTADPDGVYALVSPCRLVGQPNCPAPSLWQAAVGGPWSKVPITLPKGIISTTAVLTDHGSTAYLVMPTETHPDILEVTEGGSPWSSRPSPCIKSAPESLDDVAPVTDTRVALLCVGGGATGEASKRVLRSGDSGQTTTPAGFTPLEGIVSQIAATPDGTLLVSSWSANGSWIYRNAGGRTWTTSVSLEDEGVGWNDMVFTSDQVGFVVYGPAGVFPYTRPGLVMETTDGGLTWSLI
ncbi:MAG TPA: hypothetical protein VGH10_12255 [Actinomycetota bacterium]|jgi:photosystem II stability/assembly factor-like uncharacterized protein